MGNFSPFEAFFGRKPFVSQTEEETTSFSNQDQGDIQKWVDDIGETLSQVNKLQTKSRESMKKRHEIKNPPSTYEIGEKVLVQEHIIGKKIKSKRRKTVFHGIVKKKDGNRYESFN